MEPKAWIFTRFDFFKSPQSQSKVVRWVKSHFYMLSWNHHHSF
uniref:Uncharacterized protein n=1 Tax=Populus trichocarpa TaxID=3694 RepID=A0A3N7HRG9_POPTR